jgi:hypothetical protein
VPRIPSVPDEALDRPPDFPGADSDTLAEAPVCCLNCGGPWHRVDEGYACLQCGRRWRAVECLRALRRTRFQRMH